MASTNVQVAWANALPMWAFPLKTALALALFDLFATQQQQQDAA